MSVSPILPGLLYLVHDHRRLHTEMVCARTGAEAIAKYLKNAA